MKAGLQRWLGLIAGFAAIAIAIAAIHLGVGRAGGAFGRVWAHNVERGINATAFFYTELGAVREMIDRRDGRYADPARRGGAPRP